MSGLLAVKCYRATRKVVMPLARKCGSRIKRMASLTSAALSQTPATENSVSDPFPVSAENSVLPMSSTLRDILVDRSSLLEQVGWAAEQGVIADGPPRRLLANHEAELAEHRRLCAEDRLTLQSGLRRLAGLFPEPPAPKPAQPAPRRPRGYSPLGDLLAKRPKGPLH